jgi:hypothetical protein
MFQLRSGRLQRKTSGVDKSQAAIGFEAFDLVKEIRTHLINAASRLDSNQDAAYLENCLHTAHTERQAVESFVATRIAVRFSTVCGTAVNGARPGSDSCD